MNRKVKLIWDFRGPVAEQTAKHHCIHLKEFAERDGLTYFDIGDTVLSEMYAIAFITVDEALMPTFRDALKPHRGELA